MHRTIISLTKLAEGLQDGWGFHLEIVDRVAKQECLYLLILAQIYILLLAPCQMSPWKVSGPDVEGGKRSTGEIRTMRGH